MDSKLPDRSDVEITHLQLAPSRAVAASRSLRGGDRIRAHSHPRAQLLHCQEGLVRVSTPDAQWALPRGRALWIPVGVMHGIVAVSHARLETVYLRRDVSGAEALPRVIRISELAHALVRRLAALGAQDESDPGVALVVELILREISGLPSEPLGLTLPSDPDLRAYAEAVLAGADGDADVAAHAKRAGVSERTFVRRYFAQTGLSPGRWRLHARLVRGLELMASGLDVTQTAMELGYQNSSAFSDAFRRTFGTPPSRF